MTEHVCTHTHTDEKESEKEYIYITVHFAVHMKHCKSTILVVNKSVHHEKKNLHFKHR